MAQPPDFVAGSVLTAAQLNAAGLWKITAQTIGSAVTSVPVNSCFSSDYENYRIIVAGGASSANTGNNNFTLTLGATVTGYYQYAFGQTFGGVNATANVSNGAGWLCGGQTTSGLNTVIDIFRPQAADETFISFQYTTGVTTGYGLSGTGYLNNTTQYTGFTITALATTSLTGGTIYVYGWRK